MQDSQGKDNIISSAEKTIDLIELLAESGGTLTVSGIAKKLNMHVSSADRYLLTLQSRGYVNKDSRTGLFRLNETLISLSDLLVANHPLTRMYLDTMHTLAYIYNTTTHIAAFNNREAIYLHKDLQTQNMSYNRAFFDKTRYLYCSAPGKLLLSTYSDEELEDYLNKTKLIIFTKKTLSSKAAIKEDIERIRQRGYSIHDEEWLPGNLTVSFPLTIDGKIKGAMSLMCDVEHKDKMLSEETITRIKLLCKEPTN